jgi:hypothetical protein
MPIQPINYLNSQILKSPWDQDFVKLLQQGMQLRHEPQRLLRKAEEEKFANILSKQKARTGQINAQYEPERAKYEHGMLAQTAKLFPQMSEAELQKLKLLNQYGGISPTGETGEHLFAYNLDKSGHPIGPSALKNIDIKNRSREESLRLKPLQAASQVGKHNIERAAAIEALEDKSKNPTQRREAERNLRAIQLKEWLETADPASRAKYLAGEQIQKTLGMIDFDALVKGAGLGGKIWKGQEALKVPFGKESKEYVNYETSLKGLEGLAEQVGTFYGTQAATEAQNRLRKMLHDPRMLSNPRIAKAEFDYIKKLLHREHETFRDSLLYNLEDFQKVGSQSGSESGGAHNETIKAINKNTLKQQQAAAKKQGIKSAGNEKNKQPVKRYKMINGAWTLV